MALGPLSLSFDEACASLSLSHPDSGLSSSNSSSNDASSDNSVTLLELLALSVSFFEALDEFGTFDVDSLSGFASGEGLVSLLDDTAISSIVTELLDDFHFSSSSNASGECLGSFSESSASVSILVLERVDDGFADWGANLSGGLFIFPDLTAFVVLFVSLGNSGALHDSSPSADGVLQSSPLDDFA